MKDCPKDNQAFVTSLIKVCEDRGHRAALRRWWSPATRSYAFPILGKVSALNESFTHTPWIVVAAIYGVHQNETFSAHQRGGNSMGQAVLDIGERRADANGKHSMEKHFLRLLAARNLSELAPQLHRLVKRLEREAIPLDYVALLSDLRQFRNNPQKVKTRWALHFWQAPNSELPAA
jgi:CRISPR system Cascade subunit CasB